MKAPEQILRERHPDCIGPTKVYITDKDQLLRGMREYGDQEFKAGLRLYAGIHWAITASIIGLMIIISF